MRSLFAGVVVMGLAGLCAGAESAPQVAVMRPVRRDVTRWLKLPAFVEADAEITLTARISGLLKGFSADVGDRVKPGQVIGHLDAPELEQDVKLAEAQLLAAQGEYQKALAQVERERARSQQLDAQESIYKAQVEQSKAQAASAHNQCERTEKLFSKDAATAQERDLQQFTCQEKDAAVAVAGRRLDSLGAERDIFQRDLSIAEAAASVAKGKVQVAQATLDRSRVLWSYTEIKIPQIGTHEGAEAIITKRYVSNGDLISGGMTSKTGAQLIVTMQVVDPLRIVADVPEGDAIGLEAGSVARVIVPDLKTVAEFKIARTSNSLSPSSRTLRIEIDVPNPKNSIRPGMMVNVELGAETHKGVMAVPAECVLADRHQASVFAVEGNKARKIGVELGLHGVDWIEVLKPSLSESTLLIKDISEGIADGAAVEVKPAE